MLQRCRRATERSEVTLEKIAIIPSWHSAASLSLFLLLTRSGFSQAPTFDFSAPPDAVGIACRATFSPGGGCIPLILAELEQAQTRVDVAMFYFSSDSLVDMLCQLSAERGIAVRVLADSDMETVANRPVLEKLRDHGAAVIVVEPGSIGKLHHKCAVVDGKVVLTGTANWSEAAEQSNHEDVLALYSPALAAQYLARFDELQAKGVPLTGFPWFHHDNFL